MTTETMGLPTNHDNHRQQPFEHKLDIKERTQPSHTPRYLYYVALLSTLFLLLFEVELGFLVLIMEFSKAVDFSDRSSVYRMLNLHPF